MMRQKSSQFSGFDVGEKPLGNFVKNGYSESETGMSNIMFSMYFQ